MTLLRRFHREIGEGKQLVAMPITRLDIEEEIEWQDYLLIPPGKFDPAELRLIQNTRGLASIARCGTADLREACMDLTGFDSEHVCELRFRLFQPSEHDVDHGDVDHRLAGGGVAFVVFAVAAIATQPGEGPLDDPAFGQHDESLDLGWPKHGLDQPSVTTGHSGRKLVAAVGDVGEDHRQSAKPRSRAVQRPQDEERPVVILNACRMDDDGEDQAQGVDHDVPLAAGDFLARVAASTSPAHVRRLDGLTVEDCGAGRGLAAHLASELVPERIVNPLPRSVVAPIAEDAVNGFPLGEFAGKQPPGATTAEDVENRVDDRATAHRLGRAPMGSLRQKLAKDLPLSVAQIRGIFRLFRVGHRYDSFRSLPGIRRESYRFSWI